MKVRKNKRYRNILKDKNKIKKYKGKNYEGSNQCLKEY